MKSGWLYGWKDIAGYIGCTIWTAKIYHKKFELPVDRLPLGKPIAKAAKIDEWIEKSTSLVRDSFQ